MTDPRLADHATGLELQIEELVVRQDVLRHEGWHEQSDALADPIADLQRELVDTAEEAADEHYPTVTIHDAEVAGHSGRLAG